MKKHLILKLASVITLAPANYNGIGAAPPNFFALAVKFKLAKLSKANRQSDGPQRSLNTHKNLLGNTIFIYSLFVIIIILFASKKEKKKRKRRGQKNEENNPKTRRKNNEAKNPKPDEGEKYDLCGLFLQ